MLLENKIRTKNNKSLWNLFIKFITMIGKKHLLYKLEIKEVEEIIGTINCEDYNEENILHTIAYLDEDINKEKINWINFYYKKTYNKTKKEFVTNILKELNIYEDFIKNLKKSTFHNGRFQDYDKYVDFMNINDIVECAFSWERTENKYDFWDEINMEYRELLYDKKYHKKG